MEMSKAQRRVDRRLAERRAKRAIIGAADALAEEVEGFLGVNPEGTHQALRERLVAYREVRGEMG